MLQIRDYKKYKYNFNKVTDNILLMLRLKAVDNVVRFRVRGSSCNNTAAL